MTVFDFIIGFLFITTIIHAPKVERYKENEVPFIVKVVLLVEGLGFMIFPYYLPYRLIEMTDWITDKGFAISICVIIGTVVLVTFINYIIKEGKREKNISKMISQNGED
jgi:uncharacterized membrane protein SirB2